MGGKKSPFKSAELVDSDTDDNDTHVVSAVKVSNSSSRPIKPSKSLTDIPTSKLSTPTESYVGKNAQSQFSTPQQQRASAGKAITPKAKGHEAKVSKVKKGASKRKRDDDEAYAKNGEGSETVETHPLHRASAVVKGVNGVLLKRQQDLNTSIDSTDEPESDGSSSTSSEDEADSTVDGGTDVGTSESDVASSDVSDKSDEESDGSSEDETGTGSTEGSDNTSSSGQARDDARAPRSSHGFQPESSFPRPRNPYNAPAGYIEQTVSGDDASVVQIKNALDSGKAQLWHLVIPSTTPQSEFFDVDWEKALKGDTIKLKSGASKFVHRQASQSSLLLPNSNGYQPFGQITQYMELQPSLELPKIPKTLARTPPPRSKRPQPAGLRLRFHPIGDVNAQQAANDESSNDEAAGGSTRNAKEAPASAHFKVPRRLSEDIATEPTSARKKKRKREETDEERAARRAAKKAKKDARQNSKETIQRVASPALEPPRGEKEDGGERRRKDKDKSKKKKKKKKDKGKHGKK